MPPPARPVVSKPLGSQRDRLPAKGQSHQASVTESDPDPDSLFIPGGDDDRPWDPPNYEHEEEEEMLGWNPNSEDPNASFHPTFRDSGSVARPQRERPPPALASQEGLEPTQRLSQVCFLFPDLDVPKLIRAAAWNV